MTNLKRFLGITLGLLLILVPLGSEASTSEITVFHNGTKIEFIDQAPIIVNGSTLVPIRGVAESLELEVEWDEKAKKVILNRHDIRLELRVGNKAVLKQTRDLTTTVYLDEPPTIYNGRVLLPLRGVSEMTGAEVKWDANTRQIAISTKFMEQINTLKVENKTINKVVNLNDTSEGIKVKLGNPKDIIRGTDNNEIWVFYPNTKNHIQIGVNGEIVTSISIMSQNWSLMGSQIGDSLAELGKNLKLRVKYSKSPKDYIHSPIRRSYLANAEILIFEDQRDRLPIAPLLGFEITKIDEPMDIGRYSSEDAGKITHYFINDVRINNGSKPLKWDKELYEVANYHSKDMYDNDYFSHEDAYGTFSDRAKRLLSDRNSRGGMGENITMGRKSVIESTASFYNSLGHYKNMVNIDFNYVGVGVYKEYITHVFSAR